MKKLTFIILSFMMLLGCSMNNSATKKTEEYLTKYQALSDEVLEDLEFNSEKESIGSNNVLTYQDVFKKQYQNLQYVIQNEQIEGDEAIVTVKITVYDFYKVKKEAEEFYKNNPEEVEENGIYKEESFIKYQLDKMMNTTYRVDYTIDFYLEKINDEWKVKELSDISKEKIHGLYNYESE